MNPEQLKQNHADLVKIMKLHGEGIRDRKLNALRERFTGFIHEQNHIIENISYPNLFDRNFFIAFSLLHIQRVTPYFLWNFLVFIKLNSMPAQTGSDNLSYNGVNNFRHH